MSFQKYTSDSYCVGGRYRSATKNIVGDITINKKTGKEVELLVGKCVICDGKKTMIVSHDVIQAESLREFFKNLGKKGLNVSKKMAKTVLKNPSRALDITGNIATAAASRNPKNVMSTFPELITF